MRVLVLPGIRLGPWPLAPWGEWCHAFDAGPIRVLWGRRTPEEIQAFYDWAGIT
jgi:hypothetical protein